MNVLIDTTVWSIALRKNKHSQEEETTVLSLTELIHEGRAKIIGPIRQEILSGIASKTSFDKLHAALSAFPDLEIYSDDYIRAAQMYNHCRKKGIQGSHIDFLICSIAEKHHMSIFTLDHDFINYSKFLPLILY